MYISKGDLSLKVRMFRSFFISFLLFLSLVFLPSEAIGVHAQTTTVNNTTANTDSSVAQSVASRQATLQSELDTLNTQIAQQQSILTAQQDKRQTLESAVAVLDAEIKEAELSIQARNLEIEQLTEDIAAKQSTVDSLSSQINDEKNSMADLLRKTNDLDSASLAEAVLSGQSISQFFVDLDSYSSIKSALQASFTKITLDKNTTQNEETDLQNQDEQQSNLLQIQQLQQERLKQEESQKTELITESKGLESKYQTILNAQEKSASTIRAELFTLNGSAAISFGKALQIAEQVSAKTGVRPAFLLGIIAEESDLGANIGTGNWKVDMKAPRDTVPFQQICASLGLNPDLMPVSKKPWYGYGGAMGPAQFIPSTWVQYESKVTALTGDNPPNPWNPTDAFFASGILLEENGASDGTSPGTSGQERLAAERYLAGWANASNKEYAFYGDDVMSLASNFQSEIDILNK